LKLGALAELCKEHQLDFKDKEKGQSGNNNKQEKNDDALTALHKEVYRLKTKAGKFTVVSSRKQQPPYNTNQEFWCFKRKYRKVK
jgi:hypothetical protein